MMIVYILACLFQTPEDVSPNLFTHDLTEKTLRMDESRQYPYTTVMPLLDYSDDRWVQADTLYQEEDYMGAAQNLMSLLQENPEYIAAHSLL